MTVIPPKVDGNIIGSPSSEATSGPREATVTSLELTLKNLQGLIRHPARLMAVRRSPTDAPLTDEQQKDRDVVAAFNAGWTLVPSQSQATGPGKPNAPRSAFVYYSADRQKLFLWSGRFAVHIPEAIPAAIVKQRSAYCSVKNESFHTCEETKKRFRVLDVEVSVPPNHTIRDTLTQIAPLQYTSAFIRGVEIAR